MVSLTVKGNLKEAIEALQRHGLERGARVGFVGTGWVRFHVAWSRSIEGLVAAWMNEGPTVAPFPSGSLLLYTLPLAGYSDQVEA